MRKDWSASGRDLDLHLDLDPTLGRRAGLEEALRHAVRAGRLRPGAGLPSTRALARHLGVSRGTVSAAYDQLVTEGYLIARPGSGTSVTEFPQPSASSPAPASPGPAPRAPALPGTASPAPASPGATSPGAVPRYDLRPGRPDLTAFPAAAWLRSTRRVLTSSRADMHALGEPGGRPELRLALAGYLGRARGVVTTPDQIVITSGYTQALGLLAGVLAGSGASAVAMEDPGHPFHRAIVRRAGLRILALPVDDRGARTDLLSHSRFADAAAIVLTPAHQYPTGATLSPGRRHALVSWADATGGLVIEDDYDGEFRYDRQPVGALQGMAPDHVAHVGTASKTLAPALRLAWMVLPPRITQPVAEAKRYADAHTESLGQLVVADLIASHAYDRQIRAARLRYRRRRDLLLERLHAQVPRATVSGVAAGLHALIQLPARHSGEDAILIRAAAHGLALQGMADHWHQPGGRPPGLIVGYSTPPQHAWPAALDTLCTVLR